MAEGGISARSLFNLFPKNLWAPKQKANDDAGSYTPVAQATREIPDGGLWPKENKAKASRPRKWSYSDLLTTDQAFWHCMSLVLGLGTLTIPYVLRELGWGGLVLLAMLAWVSAHTAKLLCVCIDYVPDDGRKGLVKVLNTYQDIGEAAYGEKGRRFVSFILYVDLVASSALFLIFIANNLNDIFPGRLSPTTWIIGTACTLLPTVWLKLQKLTFLSALGSYIMIILVLAILYAALSTAPESLEHNEYHWFRFKMGAVGNMIFAFAMHGTLLTIYRDMRTPADAPALFNKVYLAGYMLKLVVGATGYYLFAQNTSDQISLNLPIAWLKTGITLAVTLKKWLTYALPLEPVAVDLERDGERRSIRIRSGLVLLTVILAMGLPFFGLFQSLVGSLCAGFLVLLFPLVFYLKLYGNKISRREYGFNTGLLFVSCFLVALASYQALEEGLEMWKSQGDGAVLDIVSDGMSSVETSLLGEQVDAVQLDLNEN